MTILQLYSKAAAFEISINSFFSDVVFAAWQCTCVTDRTGNMPMLTILRADMGAATLILAA